MLRHDPIVRQYPQYLPSQDEVASTRKLLLQTENSKLWDELCQHVQIGGDPDAVLWRFCWQARQDGLCGHAVAQGALEWLKNCLQARTRLRMDSLLREGPFNSEFRELYFAAVPFSFHGIDRQGHPIVINRYGSVDVAAFERLWAAGEAVSERNKLEVNGAVLFHLRAMEYLTKVVMAEESERQGRVVDRILVIADLDGLGMRHWNPAVKSFLKSVSQESRNLFPETMHATMVANAPWLLAKGVWPIVKMFRRDAG